MKSITIKAGRTLLTIDLTQRGRLAKAPVHPDYPDTMTEWCEPEHREALGASLKECERLASCTKAALVGLITALLPAGYATNANRKSELVTRATNLLIERWFPFVVLEAVNV